MKLTYPIGKADNNNTIDFILSTKLNLSTRLLNKLIKNEKISLNDKKCDTRNIVKLGDILEIDFGLSEDNSNIIATPMELNIVYEDDWFLVINKPANIPIHPSSLHYKDSLSNGIKFYFDSLSLAKKIRPVNRLDLGTSGLVIFAKCEYIQECFIRQMTNKTFQKEYLCLIERISRQKNWYYRFANCKKKRKYYRKMH